MNKESMRSVWCAATCSMPSTQWCAAIASMTCLSEACNSSWLATCISCRQWWRSRKPCFANITIRLISSPARLFNLFRQGKTIDEIAVERGLTKGTIIGHLTPYVKEGKIGLRTFISTSREDKIRNFMEAHPEMEHFSEIKEALGGNYEYWEIKLIHDLRQK